MVAFGDFVAEVKRERAYFQQGGTSWRKEVASLSEFLLIQSPIRTVDYFRDKNNVVDLAKSLIPGLENNIELMEDIGEFTSYIARSLTANLPTEVSEYVEMQRQKRKGKLLRFKDKIE